MILYLKDPKNSSMKHLSPKTFAEQYQDVKTTLKNRLSYFTPITAFQEKFHSQCFQYNKIHKDKTPNHKSCKKWSHEGKNWKKTQDFSWPKIGSWCYKYGCIIKNVFQVKLNPQQNLNVFFTKLEHIILKFIQKQNCQNSLKVPKQKNQCWKYQNA